VYISHFATAVGYKQNTLSPPTKEPIVRRINVCESAIINRMSAIEFMGNCNRRLITDVVTYGYGYLPRLHVDNLHVAYIVSSYDRIANAMCT